MRRFLVLAFLFCVHVRVCEGANDLYGALGLERGAGAGDIKKAYRSLSLIYHPDKQRNVDDVEKAKAGERFVEIQKAYAVLSDEESKRVYDLQIYLDESETQTNQGAGFRGRGTWDSGSTQEGLRQQSGFQEAELIASETALLNEKNIEKLVFRSQKTWLIQIYDDAIDSCHRAGPIWEQASRMTNGVANFGRVNTLTSPRLVQLLGSSGLFSRPIRRSDLPVIVGVRPNCRHYSCIKRYRGSIKVNLLLSFVGKKMLTLPDLVAITPNDVQSMTSYEDKVKFVYVSSKRPPLMVRYLAEEYSADVDVVWVDYETGDTKFWEQDLGVKKEPAMIIFRDFDRTVVDNVNSKDKIRLTLAQYRFQVIPRLTASNAHGVGCEPGGLTRVCFVAVGSKRSPSFVRLMQELANVRSSGKLSLTEDEVAFGWIDGLRNKKFVKTFANGTQLVALMFHRGKRGHVYYDQLKDWSTRDTLVAWISRVLVTEEGLPAAEFDAHLLFPIPGAPIDWRLLMKALRTDVSDMAESLWFFCLENGILPLVGTIFAIVAAGWFRVLVIRAPAMRKTAKQTSRKPQIVNLVDVHGTRLKEKSVYIAMVLESDSNSSFRDFAKDFKSEKLLAFVEASERVVDAFQWNEVFEDHKSNIIVWHPSRAKFQDIGNLDDRARVEARLNEILNGLGDWTDLQIDL